MVPASVMTMDSTEAKIGRLMKKRENTVLASLADHIPGVAVRLRVAAGLLLSVAVGHDGDRAVRAGEVGILPVDRHRLSLRGSRRDGAAGPPTQELAQHERH